MGVYAPTIRFHDGRFRMITTNVTHAGARNFFVTADDPAGPWSEPTFVDVAGIDPDLAWDADGNCWLHFSRAVDVARARIDDTTGEVLEAPVFAWAGTGLQYPEAPHLYERDGAWYLLIAEGGTHAGHAVSIARGPSPVGPWEGCPANPIFSHRSTDKPIQNTGHSDLVEATDGSWWLVLLGVRPRGVSSGFHVLGRETFLVPVEWRDGWPVIGALGLEMDRRPPGPVEANRLDGRADFDRASLPPRWIGARRAPAALASLDARPGWLTLHGTAATLDDDEPVFVGRRQQHLQCRVRARVDPGTSSEAGLAIVMDDTFHYEVAVRGDEVVAHIHISSVDAIVGTTPRPGRDVVLAIETRPHPHGPDVVVLGVEDDRGAFREIAEVDGRYLSTEVAGGFTGRVIGMYAIGGDAAFDWFDYKELA
jgi:beta-xylosidase